MLVREKDFHVYCDHSNMMKLFSPDHEVKQHVKGKLQRWALTLAGCRYVICHIAGENNLWPDIVSRWGQPPPEPTDSAVAFKRVTSRSAQTLSELRPLQDGEFMWPTRDEIATTQRSCKQDAPPGAVMSDDALTADGKLWVPSKAKTLLKRLLVTAHCGVQGHRGIHVMVELLDRHFTLSGTRQVVISLINECLLCKHVKGGALIQRDWTVDRSAASRNECMHMDYLYLGESYGEAKIRPCPKGRANSLL